LISKCKKKIRHIFDTLSAWGYFKWEIVLEVSSKTHDNLCTLSWLDSFLQNLKAKILVHSWRPTVFLCQILLILSEWRLLLLSIVSVSAPSLFVSGFRFHVSVRNVTRTQKHTLLQGPKSNLGDSLFCW